MDADTLTEPTTVRVDLGDRSYNILIGAGLLRQAGALIAPFVQQKRVFVLSDETVWGLHGETLKDGLAGAEIEAVEKVLPAGERTKNWTLLGETVDWLLAHGAGRDDVLIALGGGVIGDLTGFAAGDQFNPVQWPVNLWQGGRADDQAVLRHRHVSQPGGS